VTRYIVPNVNGAAVLATLIGQAQCGDVIVVPTDAAKELGERALARMCPGKKVIFSVEASTCSSEDAEVI